MFFWQCSIHKMALCGGGGEGALGPNSPKYCPILLKFAPEVVFKETQSVWKILKNQIFTETKGYPKFAHLVQLWPLFPSWRWLKSNKVDIFHTKIQPLGYPTIAKWRPYLFSPLNEKQDYLRTFWAFLGEYLGMVKG